MAVIYQLTHFQLQDSAYSMLYAVTRLIVYYDTTSHSSLVHFSLVRTTTRDFDDHRPKPAH